VLDELEAIRGSRPPSAEELNAAKRFNAGRFALTLETSSAIAASLIDLDLYHLPTDSLDTYRTRVRAVTLGEAAAQARERLHPERAAIVVAGPADTLVKQLEGYGAVEVVAP
jgi:zinc protease